VAIIIKEEFVYMNHSLSNPVPHEETIHSIREKRRNRTNRIKRIFFVLFSSFILINLFVSGFVISKFLKYILVELLLILLIFASIMVHKRSESIRRFNRKHKKEETLDDLDYNAYFDEWELKNSCFEPILVDDMEETSKLHALKESPASPSSPSNPYLNQNLDWSVHESTKPLQKHAPSHTSSHSSHSTVKKAPKFQGSAPYRSPFEKNHKNDARHETKKPTLPILSVDAFRIHQDHASTQNTQNTEILNIIDSAEHSLLHSLSMLKNHSDAFFSSSTSTETKNGSILRSYPGITIEESIVSSDEPFFFMDNPDTMDILDTMDNPTMDILGTLDNATSDNPGTMDILDPLDNPTLNILDTLDNTYTMDNPTSDNPTLDILDTLDNATSDNPTINNATLDSAHTMDNATSDNLDNPFSLDTPDGFNIPNTLEANETPAAHSFKVISLAEMANRRNASPSYPPEETVPHDDTPPLKETYLQNLQNQTLDNTSPDTPRILPLEVNEDAVYEAYDFLDTSSVIFEFEHVQDKWVFESSQCQDTNPQKTEPTYTHPSLSILTSNENPSDPFSDMDSLTEKAQKLVDTLQSFGVGTKVVNISQGPSITRFELQPDKGVKVSKIVSLTDDIALNLKAASVRMEAPIPGKAAIGIEIPNHKISPVYLREVIESEEFKSCHSKLAFAVGKDITGNVVIADISQMPHLLIAGATGSGKSVCINSLIASILYRSTPNEVKLILIDPKVVELSIYNGIPHLLSPVVTDPKKASAVLSWAVFEMNQRYKQFAQVGARDLAGYNAYLLSNAQEPLAQIVIIIDELADLMMVSPKEVEDSICRLAQMARAAGMHIVIATQRPSVDVITGLIKANIPSRISFAVSSQVDSRTILDLSGAEKLVGKGDMLFNPIGFSKPLRVQGCFISDKEVETIVRTMNSTPDIGYDPTLLAHCTKETPTPTPDPLAEDELFYQAVELVLESGSASTSLIQRRFRLGYARAARIMDQLEAWGIISTQDGSKPRSVLISKEEWLEIIK
jgi:DNA segregation ATPase FtsK/SpoIIIE-like protein